LLEKLRYEEREQKFKLWQDRFDDVFIKSGSLYRLFLTFKRLDMLSGRHARETHAENIFDVQETVGWKHPTARKTLLKRFPNSADKKH